MARYLLALIIAVIGTLPVFAKHLHTEAEYQQAWCNAHNGIMEYQLPDYARVDCMATVDGVDYAIEFDFSRGAKVYECIGQALYYGLMTSRKAGAVLIVEDDKDYFYLKRFQKVAEAYGIKYWVMRSLEDTSSCMCGNGKSR